MVMELWQEAPNFPCLVHDSGGLDRNGGTRRA